MRRSALLLSAAALWGCKYTPEKYAEDLLDARCDKLQDCEEQAVDYFTEGGQVSRDVAQSAFDTMYVALCESDYEDTGLTPSSCTFNADNAKACIDGIKSTYCDATMPNGFAFPAECSATCE